MKKTAIITGGTKGIGKQLVYKFALSDFNIATCSRNEKELHALKKSVEQIAGVDVLVKKTDMSVKEEVLAFAEQAKRRFPTAEVLINNAGVFVPGQVHREEEGMLEKMMDTNLYSAYHLSRAIIPDMMEIRRGHIFNICSTASFVPYVNGGSYCISKFALLGFGKVLREELKSYGIRVTSVMPGATMSASWQGTEIPEERFMKAEDVAEAVYNVYTMSERTVIEEIVMRPQLGDI